MSIDIVKDTLLKAKNQLIVQLNSAIDKTSEQVNASIDGFAEDVDADKLKASVQAQIKDILAGIELYPAQAAYELTEMVNDYEARVAELQTELKATVAHAAGLNEELTNSYSEVENAINEVAELKAQINEHQTSFKSALENAALQSKALAEQVEILKKQRDNYKAQYEAVIADANPAIQLPGSGNQYTPPAAPDADEADANIYEAGRLELKKMRGSK